ncbi:MAG: hypothetical protein Q8Q35_00230 [Nanoarchaeota archaeon]|nr:hypothetical protein [Nanoarchaeota archaeon]
MKRKVTLHGPTSLTISLPAEWVKINNILKGDELEIKMCGDSLIISPNKIDYAKSIDLDISSLKENIINMLLAGMHKNGYSTLNITCNSQQLKIIQKRINSLLMGYEIVEVTDNGCIVKSISKIEDTDFNKLFKRVFLVTIVLGKSLVKYIENDQVNSYEDLLTMEETNNKLTNYIHRIINLKNSNKDFSYIYVISWLQEKIADDYKRIAFIISNKGKLSKKFIDCLKKVNKLEEDYFNLFYKFDFNELDILINRTKELKINVGEILKENKENSIDEYEACSLLLSIINNIYNSFGSAMAYNN